MMIHQTMKYPTGKVLARITENRDKHVSEYVEAKAGYETKRAELTVELVALTATPVVATGDIKTDLAAVSTFIHQIASHSSQINSLPKPENHTDDYDRAIDMLGTCSETEVEMDGDTFDKYMRDQWKWKQEFTKTSSTYTSKG